MSERLLDEVSSANYTAYMLYNEPNSASGSPSLVLVKAGGPMDGPPSLAAVTPDLPSSSTGLHAATTSGPKLPGHGEPEITIESRAAMHNPSQDKNHRTGRSLSRNAVLPSVGGRAGTTMNIRRGGRDGLGRFAAANSAPGHPPPPTGHSAPPAASTYATQGESPTLARTGVVRRRASTQSISPTSWEPPLNKKQKMSKNAKLEREWPVKDRSDAHPNVAGPTITKTDSTKSVISIPSNPGFSPQPYLSPMLEGGKSRQGYSFPRSVNNSDLLVNSGGVPHNQKEENGSSTAEVSNTVSGEKMPGHYPPKPQGVLEIEAVDNESSEIAPAKHPSPSAAAAICQSPTVIDQPLAVVHSLSSDNIDSPASRIDRRLDLLLKAHQTLLESNQTLLRGVQTVATKQQTLEDGFNMLGEQVQRLGSQVEQITALLRSPSKPPINH
ncbi:hypothetical protein QFC21_005198 [Naganishia friedmannii]|uniref:Uncharacterized protein n=1 Tax=Naganishia friedmannii TaxID=89922 RepID=A0ACC2VC05_9TREE|nr:hypothetical protein QFC21_005198 [Naganishia friedmannii]